VGVVIADQSLTRDISLLAHGIGTEPVEQGKYLSCFAFLDAPLNHNFYYHFDLLWLIVISKGSGPLYAAGVFLK
jgi:hypothetical protein